MTLKARTVLNDCKSAHSLLEDETDEVRLRLFWVAGVALLRAVGHVLHKVDSEQSPALKLRIERAFSSWKKDREANAILWEFIEDERNNLLKEYDVGFLSGPVHMLIEPEGQAFTLDENLFCPISDGRYAGEDGRDVMAGAIAWWENQLANLEGLPPAA
jgi:hypothetical protein